MRPNLLLSLFSLSLCLLSTFQTKARAQELIHNTCKTTSEQNPNISHAFCTTSLQAAPASRCASLKGLGKISLRLIRDNLTDTKCHVRWLKKTEKLDPFVRSCLEDCYELYSDAIPAIKKAWKHYDEKRFMDANIEVSSVIDAATTCEDGFMEKRGVVCPLSKRNGDTSELSAMALAIMKMIQSNSY